MVSHVANESGSFIPSYVVSAPTFQKFLGDLLPEPQLAGVRADVSKQYDCTAYPYYGDYRLCVSMLIRDSTFTCNTRNLYFAYYGSTYMMQYSFPAPHSAPALHASDLVPEFINSNTDIEALLKFLNVSDAWEGSELLGEFHDNYKKYLASFAVYGNPFIGRPRNEPVWRLAYGDGNEIRDVMEVRFKALAEYPFFDTITDTINTGSSCDFWTKTAQKISSLMSLETTEWVYDEL
jgi:hypothetical protein